MKYRIGIMCLLTDHGNESWFRGVRIYFLSGYSLTVYAADEILGCNHPCSLPQRITNLENLLILFRTTRGFEPPSV
jgi:hypothetical protein